jgi:peroxiredoxin
VPVFLALIAIGGCGASSTAGPGGSAPAHGFSLTGLDGKTHRLADYRGQVVLINFWATWCIPCRAEMPDLEHEYRVHRGQGLVVLGIDWREDAATARAFTDEIGVTYPVLLDRSGSAHDAYEVGALPETFYVDRQGRLISSRLGIAGRDKLESEISQALAKS